MNSIKTYLLTVLLLLIFGVSAFSQNTTDDKAKDGEVVEMSKTDSVLVNCYHTEQEYNRIHGINQSEKTEDPEYIYEDEIYSDEKHRKRSRNTFWDNVPAELVVDVVVNAFFFIAILWQ